MICVAGMPRSGTSLVTQLLHRSGVHLGSADELMPPSINNPDGFWENLLFVRLNDRLLTASGGTWFAPPAQLLITRRDVADAKAILARFEAKGPWAWKDPRNALTLPFWKSLLPSMKVLVCIRHPMESASSLIASTLVPRTAYWSATRRGSRLRLDASHGLAARAWGTAHTAIPGRRRRAFIREMGLELWRVSNETILRETARERRLVVHYDSVLKNPRAELERLLAFADVHVTRDAMDGIVSAVRPRLRHHVADDTLRPELAALYERLSREARE